MERLWVAVVVRCVQRWGCCRLVLDVPRAEGEEEGVRNDCDGEMSILAAVIDLGRFLLFRTSVT
jgi:hypothetical protein